ncbi:Uncharacterised protein [Mycobacteroides abscessus]|nr:Uncharacterised protein [Mycobacteroides abscessus]
MTLSTSRPGNTPMNIAGMIAKYFATSLAIENVVSAPRVMRSCLPMRTTSMSFVGSESRSTMLPASFAADVPEFIATPTSACARAGASFVPSPVMATRLPPSCSARMSASLSSGVASARKSSTPASCAMAAAVSGLSPVIITVRMPIDRSSAKRSAMPSLTTSLRWTTPSTRLAPSGVRTATTSGVPPDCATSSTTSSSSASTLDAARSPPCSTHAVTAEPAPLRIWVPSGSSSPDIRVCAVNGTISPGAVGPTSRPPRRASSTIDVPSGVGSARDDSAAARTSSRSSTSRSATNRAACRLP